MSQVFLWTHTYLQKKKPTFLQTKHVWVFDLPDLLLDCLLFSVFDVAESAVKGWNISYEFNFPIRIKKKNMTVHYSRLGGQLDWQKNYIKN